MEVIGENMSMVDPMAQQLKNEGYNKMTYQLKTRSSLGNLSKLDKEANRSWFSYWIKQKGATIVDDGIDPSRANRSPFYGVEQRSLRNWNYTKVVNYNP